MFIVMYNIESCYSEPHHFVAQLNFNVVIVFFSADYIAELYGFVCVKKYHLHARTIWTGITHIYVTVVHNITISY